MVVATFTEIFVLGMTGDGQWIGLTWIGPFESAYRGESGGPAQRFVNV